MSIPLSVAGLTLDAGALIGIDRGTQRMGGLLLAAARRNLPISVPVGVLGQLWRNGAVQARLTRFLAAKSVDIVTLDERVAKAAGERCGRSGHADLVDASVVVCALANNHAVVTSDPGDLAKLAPRLLLLAV
ncbi:MAG: PIN domain nuclease [Acidimicrobiales bacterium]|nr:MAG: PIN domain nuclease [Acidimicrobiales bacterium]